MEGKGSKLGMGQGSSSYMPNVIEKLEGKEASQVWNREVIDISSI